MREAKTWQERAKIGVEVEIASRGDLEGLRALLTQHPHYVNARFLVRSANTLLTAAAMRGQLAAVLFLLKQNADEDRADSFGGTALWWAARGGHTEVVAALCDAAAEVDKADVNGTTPIMRAASTRCTPFELRPRAV